MKKQWLKLTRTDLSFGKDDANRFLPWIIGFMVFVTCITLSGWISLHTVIDRSEHSQSLSFTVNIPPSIDNATAQAQKVLALLQSTRGVANAKLVSNADMKNLVRPWLGDSDSMDALPLPLMIEASQSESGSVDLSALEKSIKATIPQAELDSRSGWIQQYTDAIASIRWMTLGIAALFLIMLACIVTFTAKTSVRLHDKAVQILHSIGAFDSYIAKQFETNVAVLALKGSAIGTFAGALCYQAASWTVIHFDTPLLPRFEMSTSHAILFIALPVMVIVIAILTTRLTVLDQLKQKP